MYRRGVQDFLKISPSSLYNNIFFSRSLGFIYKGRYIRRTGNSGAHRTRQHDFEVGLWFGMSTSG